MKKKTLLFYLVLFAGVQVFGQGDSWKKITSVPGCTARTYSVAFSINGKGYYGTGIDSVTNKENSDIWMYDSGQDSWTQVASLPVKSGASVYNVGRSAASAFTVNDMGYVVGGYSSDLNIFLKDVWEFDAATNTWTSKADFPGFARAYAIAVGSDMWGAGFYGTGFSFKQGAGWT
ncbi:MAG TPA: kelch repeat-containing protein, partial [Chitinophagaceae bacterium]|nr:kelch repeat-containing protein [Chitinophagaceae bacterium]